VGLNTAGIDALLANGSGAALYVGIGDGPAAADQVSSARVQVTRGVSGGVITATGVPYEFTGTANAPATHALLFSAAAGGTFYGYDELTGDETFSASGGYALTSLTITGSSPA